MDVKSGGIDFCALEKSYLSVVPDGGRMGQRHKNRNTAATSPGGSLPRDFHLPEARLERSVIERQREKNSECH